MGLSPSYLALREAALPVFTSPGAPKHAKIKLFLFILGKFP